MAFDDFYRLSSHAVIRNDQSQVLLLKATYGDLNWGLPGGALDQGETIHQCLIRECKEELGCDIEIDYLSGVYYHSAYQSHAFIFSCHLIAQQTIQLSDEHSEWKWFNISELSPIQKIRIQDCIDYTGTAQSRSF